MRTLMWIAAAALCGCTSKTTHPDGATSGHTFSWDVDGTHYDGEPQASASVIQGTLVVTGMDMNGHVLALSLTGTTPNTYDLTNFPGTSFTYTDHMQSWIISTTAGGTGTAVITIFTATEVVGTFVANPVPTNGATGMPAITNGEFDLAL